jgi:multidrug efflux pump
VIARFFIDRPIFASALSLVTTLAGGVALLTLPVAQYPHISPPTVQVSCTYPGASAQVVSESVAAPIEQQVNGVEHMMYMSSQCSNDGAYNLTVTFKHGVDLNMAQVLVQNRVSLATPMLPEVIRQTGVITRKKAPDILMSIAFSSPDGRYDGLFLSNFAFMRVKDELARLPGVSDVTMFGQRDYSMRVWLDPARMAARGLTAGDLAAAIREQNAAVATGQIGRPPAVTGQAIQVPLDTLGRLKTVEQFNRIVVKATPDGRTVRLRDVARVELGAKNQDVESRVNGRPCASLAVFQLPDANALETADVVKAKLRELGPDFPEGVTWEVRYDTTPYIRESIGEVYKTLREAVVLVAVVVLLFLQSWRSSVIPLVAVPVGIVGTFAVMAVMGFSLNNLTLFGLVLAIGIVVDDAIVVVESVEHHIEHGMAPRDATVRAMEEVSGPVVAIALVLSAVFVPCAFVSGIVGQFYRQFALTIASSTVISAFNSLTLSPALAALLLRPRGPGRPAEPLPRPVIALIAGWFGYALLGPRLAPALARWPAALPWVSAAAGAVMGGAAGWLAARPLNGALAVLFGGFNAAFRAATRAYGRFVAGLLRVSALVVLTYGGMIYLTYWSLAHTPKGFIPSQDMGYLLVNVQLPDSSAVERTSAVMRKIERMVRAVPGVKFTYAITGQSLLLGSNGSNFGSMFVILDDFANRHAPGLYSDAIAKKLRARFRDELPEAETAVLGPPPIRGVGRAGGFKLMVEDRGDVGPDTLQGQTDNLTDVARTNPGVVGLMSVFRANVPQLFVDIDRHECLTRAVSLSELFDALRIYLGSLYVNDFTLFGRPWQVILQADARFRDRITDVRQLQVRNARGGMVPLGALASVQRVNGPLVLTRYNMYPAAPINGSAAPGVSSGTAIGLMERLADRELSPAMKTEWTELAYLELQSGNTAMAVFGAAVVMVFLVLAAQYESWSLPLAVILVVPLCLLFAVLGVWAAGQDANIFTQIGFVVLVGLACKNAILIVEFAKQRRDGGAETRRAVLDACTLRLRPIVMTSVAFIMGVVPLLTSRGAGAEMRHTLGTTVFSGMLGVTVFGIVLTPVFFVVVDRLGASAALRAAPVRLVSALGLELVSFRSVRRLAAQAWRRAGLARRPTSADGRLDIQPPANGHAGGPAAGAPGDGEGLAGAVSPGGRSAPGA